jgi:hypothetical protein
MASRRSPQGHSLAARQVARRTASRSPLGYREARLVKTRGAAFAPRCSRLRPCPHPRKEPPERGEARVVSVISGGVLLPAYNALRCVVSSLSLAKIYRRKMKPQRLRHDDATIELSGVKGLSPLPPRPPFPLKMDRGFKLSTAPAFPPPQSSFQSPSPRRPLNLLRRGRRGDGDGWRRRRRVQRRRYRNRWTPAFASAEYRRGERPT